jgi:hypothetical protein
MPIWPNSQVVLGVTTAGGASADAAVTTVTADATDTADTAINAVTTVGPATTGPSVTTDNCHCRHPAYMLRPPLWTIRQDR